MKIKGFDENNSNTFGKRLQDENKPVSPIIFGKKKPSSPISFYEKDVNTQTRFAITKDTEGGKYISGGFIYFSLKGVTIYTELNNVIFVDLDNNSFIVKEYAKATDNIAPTNPEERKYIILYTDLGYETAENDFALRWVQCTGRMNAFEDIKSNIPVIDLDKSLVMVDNVALKDALSVREFCKYLQNAEYINKEEFNIDDYDDYNSDYV